MNNPICKNIFPRRSKDTKEFSSCIGTKDKDRHGQLPNCAIIMKNISRCPGELSEDSRARMELWAELLVRDYSSSVLGEDPPPDGSGVADRSAIADGGKSREASDAELRLMLKSVTERVTGERVADCEDVDGLTRRILKFQLDRRRPQEVQFPQCFGPM